MIATDMIIPNHYSAKLSMLDLEMAVCIPPGGNWKDIPLSIPSKRLETIRTGFALGNGSRSTYYGRLHPERPAYTINTYFNRPGNGCHLHYDHRGGQHRVISEREAARLQSFPDDFMFLGSHTSIHRQIGNAVPPLLAFQIARALPVRGQFIDLFSGAGGLSLGLKWAGWEPLVANDIDSAALDTYRHNIHPVAVCGDLRRREIFDAVYQLADEGRSKSVPLFVVGGPPCQGFSTAGKRRSLSDARNHLFSEFKALIQKIKPDGFIFENVMGLLSMEKGSVFEMIKSELRIADNNTVTLVAKADQFGIPQKRNRVILVSTPKSWPEFRPPESITSMESSRLMALTKGITSRDALSDLPPLLSGEDGSNKDYNSVGENYYQQFMRGAISASEYLRVISYGEGFE